LCLATVSGAWRICACAMNCRLCPGAICCVLCLILGLFASVGRGERTAGALAAGWPPPSPPPNTRPHITLNPSLVLMALQLQFAAVPRRCPVIMAVRADVARLAVLA